MQIQKQAKKIDIQIKDFLEKNPELKEALRIFDISYNQYRKALESSYYFYTDISTNPKGTFDLKTEKPK